LDSLARSECTYGSDIDVFLVGRSWRKAEQWLQHRCSKRLGINVEMYATTLTEEIPAFLGELSDYFVDFQNAKNAYGSEETWSAF